MSDKTDIVYVSNNVIEVEHLDVCSNKYKVAGDDWEHKYILADTCISKAKHLEAMTTLLDEIKFTVNEMESTIEPSINAQTYNNAYCNALGSVCDLINKRISTTIEGKE